VLRMLTRPSSLEKISKMKRIGVVGGISWYSSLEYYKFLNRMAGEYFNTKEETCADMLLVNIDVIKFRSLVSKGDDDGAYKMVLAAAKNAKAAGAEILILAANGVHRFFDRLQKDIDVPMVHIADATGSAIIKADLKKVGLIGIRATMEKPFYSDRLRLMGIETIIPEEPDRTYIDSSINAELVCGQFHNETKEKYLEIIKRLIDRGAQGIILGCTEIPILIKPCDTTIPQFVTSELHCAATIKKAFSRC